MPARRQPSTAPDSTRILVVEDHPLIVDGLRVQLDEMPGVCLVGTAGDAATGVRLACDLQPHLVLMDIHLDQSDGLEAVDELAEVMPDVLVIMLTMYDDDEYVRRAARAGARGYVLKSAHPGELQVAIRTVLDGGLHFPGPLGDVLVRDYVAASQRPARVPLTPRELDVLTRIAGGRINKEIAEELDLSVRTVETYRERLMKKLDLHSVADLTRYAIAEGLIRAE